MDRTSQRVGRKLPMYAATATIVLAMAGAVCMLILHRAYRAALHESAAEAVLTRGRRIAADLAVHPFASGTGGSAEAATFRDVVLAVARLDPTMQYVSVTRDGEILFHEQLRTQGETPAPIPTDEVRVKRRRIDLGAAQVPVVTFTKSVQGPDGHSHSVQVALQREALAREESGPAAALGAMFRTALVTMTISFGTAVLIVVWLVRRELRREQLRHEAEHLAFAGALANGIIHDVRNPLSSLGLDVQMLQRETQRKEGVRTDRLQELAGRVRRTVDRVDNVFSEFLYVSAPRGETPEHFDMRVAANDCVDLLRPRFERAKVQLELTLGDEGCPVQGHAVELKRAMINVMMNALQASAAGDTVRVGVRRTSGEGLYTVEDEGAGIPPPQRRKVFDMFFTTRPGGTGLGLTLSRAAVENHGGRIEVGDADGGGARIRFVLPLRDAPRAGGGA